MKKVTLLIHFIIFPVLLWSTPAVPYSGKIDINGVNYFGDSNFTFSIYDEEGITHWKNGTKDKDSIKVTIFNGRYTVLLGGQGMNPLPSKVFLRHEKLYIKVHFDNGDGNGMRHLSPDQQITATPLALAAEYARIAESVAPGSITKDMLSADVLSDLNRTQTLPSSEPSNSSFEVTPGSITHELLSPAVLADLNSSISQITREMLPPSVLADLNKSISRSDLPPSVLADLNRTITKSNLGNDILSDLNASIKLDRLSPEVLTALQIAPSISTQTFARYDPLTQTARIEALARGHNLSYQWLNNGQPILGANTPLLELNNPLLDDNATYALLVANSIGQATSNALTLRQAVGVPPSEMPELGLIGHWTFDEGIGVQAHDISGNRRHATLTNMDESAAWVSGAFGTALHFDGTNDNLSIPVINGEIKTLALWMQPDPGTGVRPVISVGNMSRIRLNDPLGSVGLMVDQNTSTFAQSSSTGNLISSDWVHLVFRWNGGTNSYQILVDGVAKPTTAGSTGHVPLRQDINLFVSEDNGSRYAGKMDDLRIYSRSLSNLEIQALCDQDGDGLNAPRELLAGTNPNNPDSDGDGETDLEEIISGSSPQDVNETAMTLALKNGLLTYLPFDETNGTQFAMDVSGKNRYATLLGFESNQSIWVAGRIGNAIRFDGVNDYATVPATLGSNFTVCFWIKTTSNAGNATATNWNGPIGLVVGPVDSHALMLADGKFRLWSGAYNRCRRTSNTSVNHGSWIHLSAARQHNIHGRGHMKIFINGNSDQSHEIDGTNNNTGSILHIGRTPDGTAYLNGLMDELFIYNRILGGNEIKSIYDRGVKSFTFISYGFEPDTSDSNATLSFQDALVTHIPFDETNGTQLAMDVSGNNRYATLLGFESNQSIWEAGRIGNAIRFDGVNDYATVPASLGSNFTVCLWIKTTSNDGSATATNWNGPIGLVAGPLDSHALMLASGRFRLWSGTSNRCRRTSNTSVNHGSWIHLSAARQHNIHGRGHMKIFINGNSDQSHEIDGTNNNTGSILHIGRTPDGTAYLNGLMDDLRIYNRTLTNSEVQAVYNLGL